MPLPVAIAAALQLLLAATFVVITVTVWFTGGAAQRAAEAEMARQGHSPELLARHGIRFAERGWELALALAIAAALVALGALNLAGNGTGRLSSWIAQPIVLVGAGLVTGGQVFAARFTEAALAKSGDAGAGSVDVRRVIAAASSGFPAWVRPLVVARFVLTTLGSLAVIALLATPSAGTYFG